MAIAKTRTGLSLDRFSEIIGVHPLHFNQVQIDDSGLCDYPVLQYQWQSADRTSREGIALAIAEAENRIEQQLGFPLAPRWISSEEHTFTTQHTAVQTYQKHVQYGGVQAKSLVSAARPIVYTDEDGDGYKETATVTVNTTLTNTDEIEVYYPSKAGDDEFEIRNTKIAISGGVATITFRREQCLLTKFLAPIVGPKSQDANTDANFLATVDVYRRYNDPSLQVELLTYNDGCSACGGSGCATCAYSLQTGCMRVVDGRNGLLAITSADWSSTDQTFFATSFAGCAYPPNRVRLHYYAGLGTTKRMPDEWERAVAYYALSLIERPICKCSHLSAIGNQWKEDLAVTEGFGGGYRASPVAKVIIGCPLGTTRAAVNAWRLVQQYQVGEAAIHP